MPPMQLPPSIPPAIASLPTKNDDDSSKEEGDELEKVLEIFNRILAQCDLQVQSSVNAKLKTLNDEWSSYDINLKKLINELAKCKLPFFLLPIIII